MIIAHATATKLVATQPSMYVESKPTMQYMGYTTNRGNVRLSVLDLTVQYIVSIYCSAVHNTCRYFDVYATSIFSHKGRQVTFMSMVLLVVVVVVKVKLKVLLLWWWYSM